MRKILVCIILMCFVGNITIAVSQQTEGWTPQNTALINVKIEGLEQTDLAMNYTMIFSINDFLFDSLYGFDTIALDKAGYTTEIGKPLIPVKNIRVALPADMKVSFVQIQDVKEQVLNGTYNIFPAQKPLPMDETSNENQFIKPDVQSYASDQPYPSKLIEFIGQSDLAGQVMADLTIYPLHYISHEKKLLLITSITFNLLGTNGYVYGDYLSAHISKSKRDLFLQKSQEMVINPEAVHLRFSPTPQPIGVSSGDYDYVIITQDSWVSAFQPLADWKTKKGVPATIVTTSWIYNNGGYNGSNVDKIRQFVQDVYTNWGTTYILLGGDVNVVPCQYMTFPTVDPEPVPNDAYYADFDSDWVCEVNVGRASVTGPGTGTGQIGTFINKIITYETNPPLTNYATNAAFFGFDLDSLTHAEECKIIIDTIFIPPSWAMTTVYDSQDGNHKTNVIAALNAGQNLANHVDHCEYNYMGTGNLNHILGLSNGDIDALTNGNRQTILYSQGCHPAEFDVSNCIAEHFVRDNNGGGIAFVGYSGNGYYLDGSYSTYSMRFDIYFFNSLFQKNLYHLGAAFTDHKNDGLQSQPGNEYYKYMFTGLTLLGDPELPVWTENPLGLNVTYPTQFFRSSPSFTTTVTSNGTPVSHAYVCLWKNNEVYVTNYTDTNGVVTFHPSPVTVGAMSVTVTKQNYLPYQGQTLIVNQLPVANFTYLPLNPLTSDLVQFSDASTDPDGTISSWLWSFGDGSISNNKNPTHHYADDGTYLVKLNITDNDGGKKAISKSITISNVPPHVNFTYLPANPLTSDTIHFNDASSDGDGTIVSWYWRFGDDGSSLSQNPSHKYSDNGVYPVTLNVTDDDGALTSKSLSISVMNVPPKANFSYQPSNPLTTDSIQFMDTSTDADGSIIAWSWSFGDGSTSTQRNPVHTYSDDGNYTVLLNVTDDDGEKNTKTRFLSVRNVPPIASFDFEPFNPMTYETVFFNSTSFEPDGVILNYTWDFGDGNHSYTRKTTHHYTEDRTYFIQLNVTDDDGDTDTIQDTILVSPNYPPNIPGTPAPTNGSNNIQLSATLGWNGGDPNSDTVTYDVYFDTANPPNKVKSNQTLTNYNPGTLNFTTTYYWKIIAWDSHGESKTSPTWHFTTRANHPPNAVPDSYNINEDSVLYVTAPGVLGNDGDPDGDIMTVVKVSETTPGSITVNGSGSFRYVPSANYYGADTFTYKVFDGFLYSAVVNVTITIHPVNDPPVLGISSPGNGSIVNRLSLTWGIPLSDVEGDQISWTIQCSNGQRTNSTGEDNGTKTLLLSGLMYSTTYKVWVNATDPNGSNTFTKRWYTFIPRITGGGGGDGGGDGASSTETINQKPVANVSAGEPYQGFVNSPVLFDGTSSYDPNGTITTWFWMFSDTTNGTGKKINHTFSAPGTYTVTLVVIDAEGASDTDSTTCLILLPNRPPSKPIITGPVNGTTNITYNFTVVSTDEDNETIRYSVIWGDETSYANMSDFLPSGTEFSCNHRWRTPGQYTLTVTSTDNQTMSSSQLTINIETVPTLITEPTTPGFDFVFVLCAISIVLFLLRKKRRL